MLQLQAGQMVNSSENAVTEKVTPSNFFTFLYTGDSINDEHNCSELVQTLGHDQHLQTTPVQNLDKVLFTDYSSMVENGE